MKSFLSFFLLSAALVVAYTGTSGSYQAELIDVDGSNPLTAISASYQLDVVSGTLSQGPNAGILFNNPGLGFGRATVTHPQFISSAEPGNTCCGPFQLTSRWRDLNGRGVQSVLLWNQDTNLNTSAVLISGTAQDGIWQATFSTSGPLSIRYRWYAETLDGLGNQSNISTFTIVPASTLSGPTPTPAATVAPTTAPAATTQPSQSSPPISSGPTELPAPVEETQTLGASSEVSGTFGETSTVFTLSYTAPASGFSGEISHTVPLPFKDYLDGLVSVSPEAKSAREGSIIFTWDVSLAPRETFEAQVEVAKKLDPAILKEFKAPQVVSKQSAPSATKSPTATAAASQAPVPAAADNTLWYAVGAIVLLGILYYVFVGSKPKRKGL